MIIYRKSHSNISRMTKGKSVFLQFLKKSNSNPLDFHANLNFTIVMHLFMLRFLTLGANKSKFFSINFVLYMFNELFLIETGIGTSMNLNLVKYSRFKMSTYSVQLCHFARQTFTDSVAGNFLIKLKTKLSLLRKSILIQFIN